MSLCETQIYRTCTLLTMDCPSTPAIALSLKLMKRSAIVSLIYQKQTRPVVTEEIHVVM